MAANQDSDAAAHTIAQQQLYDAKMAASAEGRSENVPLGWEDKGRTSVAPNSQGVVSSPNGWDVLGTEKISSLPNQVISAFTQALPMTATSNIAMSSINAQARLLHDLDELPGSFKTLARNFQLHQDQLQTLEMLLASTIQRRSSEFFATLELAMTRAYKLAVLIRGDYDKALGNEEADRDLLRKAIFMQCVKAFTDCQQAAELGVKELGSLHAQVTALRKGKIEQFRSGITEEIQNNYRQKESLERDRATTSENLETWLGELRDATDAYMKAQQEERNLGNTARPGWNPLSGLHPSVISGMNVNQASQNSVLKKLQESQSRMVELQQSVSNAQNELSKMRARASDIEIQESMSKQMEQQLRTLQDTTEGLFSWSRAATGSFDGPKRDSAELLQLIREMENRASDTKKMSYKKIKFASDIMELCKIGLVNVQLGDEVEMIRKEIVSGYKGYGAKMPYEVEDLVLETGARLKGLGFESIEV